MSDTLLREAARALRASSHEPEENSEATRRAVMASLHGQRRRRHTATAFLIPAAALLAGSTAWASATGTLPHVWVHMKSAVGLDTALESETADTEPVRPAPRRAKMPASRPHVAEQLALEPGAPGELPPEQAIVSAGPAIERAPAEVADGTDAASAKRRASASDTVSKAHALYRAAHHAHFTTRDPASALAAWEAYLRAAPRGRFGVEARYNRALCLVRLGRHAEARAALTPFAEGRFGGYRDREATALLEALPGDGE
jgi:hypothetical protein